MKSRSACGLTVLRVVIGIIFLVHGWQKLFGLGFHGVAGMFAHIGIPVPPVTSVIVTLVEFLGGIALILGLFTRWAAALIACDMLGAIVFVHFKNGFSSAKGGYEFPLALLAAAIALALAGAGCWSADEMLFKRS